MSVHSFKIIQNIPISIPRAWDFFSDPANLQMITPADTGFHIITKFPAGKMYAGQIIEYKLSPVFNIPVYWMTEITHVVENVYFIDEQRFGPYSLWHHQHHFKEINGGIEMTDIVHYKIPYGFIGDIANALFVKKKLEKIFAYRFTKIEELFGKWVCVGV